MCMYLSGRDRHPKLQLGIPAFSGDLAHQHASEQAHWLETALDQCLTPDGTLLHQHLASLHHPAWPLICGTLLPINALLSQSHSGHDLYVMCDASYRGKQAGAMSWVTFCSMPFLQSLCPGALCVSIPAGTSHCLLVASSLYWLKGLLKTMPS